jgi:hypothetical protein
MMVPCARTPSDIVLGLFISNVSEGAPEIQRTLRPDHSMYYLLRNKPAFSQNGDLSGTGFVGSSDLTYERDSVDRGSSITRSVRRCILGSIFGDSSGSGGMSRPRFSDDRFSSMVRRHLG